MVGDVPISTPELKSEDRIISPVPLGVRVKSSSAPVVISVATPEIVREPVSRVRESAVSAS